MNQQLEQPKKRKNKKMKNGKDWKNKKFIVKVQPSFNGNDMMIYNESKNYMVWIFESKTNEEDFERLYDTIRECNGFRIDSFGMKAYF